MGKKRIGSFNINTINDRAGKYIYEFFSTDLYNFAKSNKAQKLNLFPYKNDYNNEYADELYMFIEKYKNKSIFDIMRDYHLDILTNKKKIYNSWDDYIHELYKNGLEEYNNLINKYRLTSN